MQDLRAKISEFGRLLIRENRNRSGFGHNSRIDRQHAAYVGPYLDLASPQSRPNDCGRIVRAAAAECGRHAAFSAPNKTAQDWYLAGFDQSGQLGLRGLRGFGERGSAAVTIVGPDT